MKRILTSVLLASLLFLMIPMVSLAAKISDVNLTYTSTSDVLEQYAKKDKKTVKLINNNILYNYSIANGTISKEYEFPKTTWLYQGGNSVGYGAYDAAKIYIDEAKGILYYGYNTYKNVNADKQIINIIVYDLENAKVLRTITLKNYLRLYSVAVDKNGNIFASLSNGNNEYPLLALSSAGKVLNTIKMTNPINSFAGFTKDGTFYFIESEVAYSAYGYANTMGRLGRGTFKDNVIKINKTEYDYVKNISFRDYNKAVEIVNDKYLVTFTGNIYNLSKITDKNLPLMLYAAKDLEMGAEYSHIYGAGVNTIINNDDVYTLNDNNTIFVYSLATGKKLKRYKAKKKIFNIKDLGNELLLLETDGTKFYYERVLKTKFETIKTKVYNMNDFKVYKRSKNDIIKKFIEAVPTNNDAKLYSKTSVEKKPYKEAALTNNTKTNAVNLSNYYRYLAGLTTFNTSSKEVWTRANKGAVLLAASSFDHNPAKPSDMSDAFYKEAKSATSSSNIAYNYTQNQYKLIRTIRQFLNDNGYTIPGHRDTFFTRNGNKIAYGISNAYLVQTVEYTDNPNPQGTAKLKNNEAAYAWPSPGYFPAEDISTSAVWTINLNTDKVNLSNIGAQVTITDLDTKKTYKRTGGNGLYTTSYWGRYLSFDPPELDGYTYNGKRYKVKVTNLADGEGLPATLEYTVNFFSYNNKFTIDGVKYKVNEYGVEKTHIKNQKITVASSATYTGKNLKPKVTIKGLKEDKDFKVEYKDNKKIGTATVTITGLGHFKGTVTKKFEIKIGKPDVTLKTKSNGINIAWKKVPGAKSYEVYRDNKKIKTTTSLNFTDKKVKNGKQYKYKVVAIYKKSKGTSKTKTVYYLTKPEITKVKAGSKKLTINIKKNSNASNYQIQYATNKDFTDKVSINVSASSLSNVLKNLKAKKKYYIRIRAYKKIDGVKYYSVYSDIKSATTKK